MKSWSADRIAAAAGARLLSPAAGVGTLAAPVDTDDGLQRVVIDSRQAAPGVLFAGLPGTNVDGGRFATHALAAGAWGVLVSPEYSDAAAKAAGAEQAIFEVANPLTALQRLATAWRRELNAKVIGVTGSTGKTSTKDLLLAVLAPGRRTVASRLNFNTEVGLPLEILGAPAETEVLVLEMAMRGEGQIAELAGIAEPDVAVIVSVGPVHLELLGTIEAIAAAKAELVAALPPGGTAVVPAGEPLLEPHLRADVRTITFGEEGDVHLLGADEHRVEISLAGEAITLKVNFQQAHLRRNLLAAVAAAHAIGVSPRGRVELALTPGRGERIRLSGGVTLIDDCYNANPMSMRAALEDLAVTAERDRHARRVAVLGDMLELGDGEREFHAQLGREAQTAGVDLLVTVGPQAAAMSETFAGAIHLVRNANEAARVVPPLLESGDLVLVKGSRAVGLELVCRSLRNGTGG